MAYLFTFVGVAMVLSSAKALTIYRELNDATKPPDAKEYDFELQVPLKLFRRNAYGAANEARRIVGRKYALLSYVCLGVLLLIVAFAD